MDHHGQRRTSIEIEPTPITPAGSSSSGTSTRRPNSSQQRLQLPDRDINSPDDDDRAGSGGGHKRSTHWGRNWIRYVAFACITAALVLLITLPVLRPWQQKQSRLIEGDDVTHKLGLENFTRIILTSYTFLSVTCYRTAADHEQCGQNTAREPANLANPKVILPRRRHRKGHLNTQLPDQGPVLRQQSACRIGTRFHSGKGYRPLHGPTSGQTQHHYLDN